MWLVSGGFNEGVGRVWRERRFFVGGIVVIFGFSGLREGDGIGS